MAINSNVCSQAINSNVCSHFFTFALMTTGAFSQNVGKLFSELKLVTDNLFKLRFLATSFLLQVAGLLNMFTCLVLALVSLNTVMISSSNACICNLCFVQSAWEQTRAKLVTSF